MAPTRIMLIRHAEKPQDDRPGVRARGLADMASLNVRGWTCAGALARFFDPLDDRFAHPALARPDAILAARYDARGESPSRRCTQTVKPTARLLALSLDQRFAKGQEAQAMRAALKLDGVVLLCWAHEQIPQLLRELPDAPQTPRVWPDERFDLVWVFDRQAEGWRFTQVPQMLLAGDRRKIAPMDDQA